MGFELFAPRDIFRDASLTVPLYRWIRLLDVDFYRTHPHFDGRADLSHLDNEQLIHHFVQQGWRERRAYNRFIYSFIEPTNYKERYPELKLSDELEAIAHWMYFGVFEQRIPNSVTQELIDAKIHLFQMGKVGSKAIHESLETSGYRALVPHLHWANEMMVSYPDCFLPYDELVNCPKDKEILFIAGVRDPIERAISGFYQSAADAHASAGELLTHSLPGNGPDAMERFFEPAIELILSWFDHAFYRGILVYDAEFDPERGYGTAAHGSARVFLYRLDKLQVCWAAMSEFVGMKLSPALANESRGKAYWQDYEKMMREAKFTRHFVERIVNSKLCRHFFSANERERMVLRWSA